MPYESTALPLSYPAVPKLYRKNKFKTNNEITAVFDALGTRGFMLCLNVVQITFMILSNTSMGTATLNIEDTLPVKVIFRSLREESLKHKAQGEQYDPHLELIEWSLLGKEEEELWDEYQEAKAKCDFDELERQVEAYRVRLRTEWNSLSEAERNNKAMFIAFLTNKMIVKEWRNVGV